MYFLGLLILLTSVAAIPFKGEKRHSNIPDKHDSYVKGEEVYTKEHHNEDTSRSEKSNSDEPEYNEEHEIEYTPDDSSDKSKESGESEDDGSEEPEDDNKESPEPTESNKQPITVYIIEIIKPPYSLPIFPSFTSLPGLSYLPTLPRIPWILSLISKYQSPEAITLETE